MKVFTAKKGTTKARTPKAMATSFSNTELPVLIQAQSAQSVGKTRDHMEDAIFSLSLQEMAGDQHYSLGLFIVADGMGGHMSGEVASSLAVQIVSGRLLQNVLEPMRLGQNAFTSQEMQSNLQEAVQKAQDALLSQVPGGGTTLTMALILNHQVWYSHVGDSRLYLQSGASSLQQITHDHSLVRRLVDLGQVRKSEALNHPLRNVLFRALGQADSFKADLGEFELREPGTLLLCSDGMWGLVDDKKMADILREEQGEPAAQKLVDLANEAGGTDNISVIVVSIQ